MQLWAGSVDEAPGSDGDDWRRLARCRDTDPSLFFPVGATGDAIDLIEAAKTVCLECEVRAECLEFALVTRQESGVWGGTSEDERRGLRRRWLAARRERSVTGARGAEGSIDDA